MQHITVSGRTSADAEVRNVNGNDVTEIRLAVDQGWGDKKQTNWFRVSIWGKKGSGAAPYILKGSQITVIGELEIGEFNGKPQYNIRASDFTMPAKASGQHGGQQSTGNGNGNRTQRASTPNFGGGGFGDELSDEIPFIRGDGIW